MSDALIEMQDVEKVFLTDEVETHALSNIHLAVRKNEWLSIVGPSGSGKTTLLAILGLLDTATGGQMGCGEGGREGRKGRDGEPTDA